jgi:hypothetical protein
MNIEELTKLALIQHDIDYAEPKAVVAGNKAADALRARLVEYCEAGLFIELLELLPHKNLGGWVAFVLAEFPSVSRAHRKLCVKQIKEIAKGTSSNSIGAQFWLKDHG